MRFANTVFFAALLALASSAAFANPNELAATDPPILKLTGHLVDAKGRGL